MNRIVVIVCLLLDTVILFEAREQKQCNTEKLHVCPGNAACTEVRADVHDGQCRCMPQFEFNANYQSDDDYCIVQTKKPANDNAPNETNRNHDPSSSASSNDKLHTVLIEPDAHHITVGILIPIAFVFIVLGAVFMYKQLHITHRLRNIRRGRRNRPCYEDVMLANNDNDDPPLI